MKTDKSIRHWLALLALPLASYSHAAASCNPPQTLSLEVQIPYYFSPQSNVPEFQEDKVYYGGETVQEFGFQFQARWWTKGEHPMEVDGGHEVWKATVLPNGMPQEWLLSHVYYAGEQAIWRGVVYAAKWWNRERPDTGNWQFVRAIDAFSKVRLGGTDGSQYCYSNFGSTYEMQATHTVNWSILEDPDRVIAYWKIVDELSGQGQELSRGTEKQGSFTTHWISDTYVYPSGTQTKVSGQKKKLYLCSADDKCRMVMSPDGYSY